MKHPMHSFFIGLAGAGFVASMATATEWRFNNPLPENRPESAEFEQWAQDIAAATGGDFTIKVYHGGSLGLDNTDALRYLPSGAVDMSMVWANYLGRDAPALSSVFVQGSIGTVAELEAALPVVREIYEEEFGDWGVVSTGFVALPMLEASIWCAKEPINTLEGMRGKKLRVWARDQVETFTRLGISAQIIPQEEMYVALKTGVVDCAVYPALYAHTVSLPEVAKYGAYLYPMASSPYVLGVAEDKWAALPEEHRVAVLAAGEAIWDRTNSYDDDHQSELAARDNAVAAGVTWLDDFPEADRALFLDAVSETWAMLAEEAGGKAPEYRQRVLDALGR